MFKNHISNANKTILDLCGGTGGWSKPYKDAGYDVRLWTLPHVDVRLVMKNDIPQNVYGILAAPPCTHFAVSGARWWKKKGDNALIDGLSIVDACLRIINFSNPNWWAMENPVGRLKDYLGDPEMYIQPYHYGDPYSKKTALWGRFSNPWTFRNLVEPTKADYNQIHYPRKNGKPVAWNSDEAKEMRSITPAGFAKAFFEANK